MMKLTQDDLFNFAKGASMLTTGGGLCLPEQLESIKRHVNISLELKDLNEFDEDAILVTASEVGTADAKEMDKSDVLPKMLATWEKLTGTKVAGVYAPELGQESIIIDTAIGMGVPLVDFDVAGGRAVPFVDINSFYVAGLDFSLAPLVVATDQGDIIAVDSSMSMEKLERFLRPLVSLSTGGIAYFIGGSVRVGDILNRNIQNRSISQAINLGKANNIAEIENELKPYLTYKGKVLETKEITKSGFNCYEAEFQTKSGELLTVYIQNEALFVKDRGGKFLVTPPDKILLIDENGLTGVSSKEFLSGKEITLYVVKADSLWYTDAGLKIFGPDRFKDNFCA